MKWKNNNKIQIKFYRNIMQNSSKYMNEYEIVLNL